jgi:hypothetical protein
MRRRTRRLLHVLNPGARRGYSGSDRSDPWIPIAHVRICQVSHLAWRFVGGTVAAWVTPKGRLKALERLSSSWATVSCATCG